MELCEEILAIREDGSQSFDMLSIFDACNRREHLESTFQPSFMQDAPFRSDNELWEMDKAGMLRNIVTLGLTYFSNSAHAPAPVPRGAGNKNTLTREDLSQVENVGLRRLSQNLAGELLTKSSKVSFYRIKPQHKANFARFKDSPSLLVSRFPFQKMEYSWGEPIVLKNGHYGARTFPENAEERSVSFHYYDKHFEEFRFRAQGLDGRSFYETLTMAEIKEIAESLDIPILPKKKDYLINTLISASNYPSLAVNPHRWPGWFDNGKVLVLRADSGISSIVLDRLWRASREEDLAISDYRGDSSLTFAVASEVQDLYKIPGKFNAGTLV